MTPAGHISLGCIADDYTGASDLANTLTRQGLRTVQTIGVPSDNLQLPEVDAVVVSLKSRSIAAEEAVARLPDGWDVVRHSSRPRARTRTYREDNGTAGRSTAIAVRFQEPRGRAWLRRGRG